MSFTCKHDPAVSAGKIDIHFDEMMVANKVNMFDTESDGSADKKRQCPSHSLSDLVGHRTLSNYYAFYLHLKDPRNKKFTLYEMSDRHGDNQLFLGYDGKDVIMKIGYQLNVEGPQKGYMTKKYDSEVVKKSLYELFSVWYNVEVD